MSRLQAAFNNDKN